MIAVVDSSAVVHTLTARADQLDRFLVARLADVEAQVPDIFDIEVTDALRGLVLGDRVSVARADRARALLSSLPRRYYPSRGLTGRVWGLRHNLGAYDACFIALAETLDVSLITCDVKQKNASGHIANVEVFGQTETAGA